MLILCADDYALTDGVSRAIGELAAARRLSATSVLVTTQHWPAAAARLRAHRPHLAIGLHLDLTLGRPLGPMPRLAPRGQFPRRNVLIARALTGATDAREIAGEIERQLDAFEQGLGFSPDHVDGHEHMHVLSGIRQPLLEMVARRYPKLKPLVRDPADRIQAIATRATGPRFKAAVVAALAARFGAHARRLGLPTNEGFSGFSHFDPRRSYAAELADAMQRLGPRHVLMCHPGHPDADVASLDPVAECRRLEYEALMRDTTLPARIWRPQRAPDGPPIDWSRAEG
jgi:chitin disaccharide deacetylase